MVKRLKLSLQLSGMQEHAYLFVERTSLIESTNKIAFVSRYLLISSSCWLTSLKPHAGWHHWSIQYHEGFNPFIIDWNCQHFSVWHRLKIGYPRIWLLIIIMHGKITSCTRPPKFDSLTDNSLMFIQFHSPHIKRAPMLFSANNDGQKCQKGQKGTPFWDQPIGGFRFPPEVGRASPWERCQLGLRLFLFCQNWFKGGETEQGI